MKSYWCMIGSFLLGFGLSGFGYMFNRWLGWFWGMSIAIGIIIFYFSLKDAIDEKEMGK